MTDFAFAPDGSWFTAGKNGRVTWVSASGVPRSIAVLDVVTVQDLGLTGLALAPDYGTSHRLYTARTTTVNGVWTQRLSAWTVTGSPAPTGLTGETVLWDLRQNSDVHAMTNVVAAPDGTLWVSIGDAADFRFVDPLALRALDVNEGYGKLLHVYPDGRGVPANPFYDAAAPASWKSRVYASGFRSPFRFSLDPTSGAPVLGDVGWNTWEEVDLVRPGASYGWPCWEGNTQTPGYTALAGCAGVGNSAPLFTYVHGPAGTAVTGGVVYTGSSYPAAYQGAYFFGDYSAARLYTLRYDAQGQLTRQPETDGFGSGEGAPVAFRTAANGDIVYADIGSGLLKRLVYLPGNRPPTADADITTDPATRTVTFDASRSSDLDGDKLSYAWNFGDGATGTGLRVTHTYAAPGTTAMSVRLTVTDAQGATGTAYFSVVPANRVPVLTLTAPSTAQTFAVGQPVQASATATDPEDGPLTVTWTVSVVHCSGGYCHLHPGSTTTGPTYASPFVDHGDDTSMVITAGATDSAGATTRQSFTAEPRLRTLTLTASTPAALTVNGVGRSTAQVTAGAQITVGAPAVAADGVANFTRWADGGAQQRTIVMPDADLTMAATYATPIDVRYATDAAVRAVLGAPTAPEAGDASLRYRVYQLGRLYWSRPSGVHEVHGAVLTDYLAVGGHVLLGEPVTDERVTPDGVGRFNHFARAGSVYWTQATGAHAVYGDIRARWSATGWERGPHGYPTTDELATPNLRGRFNSFQNGGIYWLPASGAHSVYGAIYAAWGRFGWEAGILGFPVTDEAGTPDGVGRFNHFEGGSVYWTQATGAHEVQGLIRDRWRALGWERSYLGYPTSDEFAVPGGRRSNFQHGYITWTAATGLVTDRRS